MLYWNLLLGVPLGLLVSLPAALLTVELLLGILPVQDRPRNNLQRQPCAILIPAHNEAAIIENTLASLLEQVQPQDQVVVIADNCTDDTAECCRQFPVTVLERHSEEKRGKGYALDYGLQTIKVSTAQPATIVVLDADCQLMPGSLDQLVSRSQQSNTVIQAQYVMRTPEGANVSKKVSEFAWLVKNVVRPLGLARLNVGCNLHGTGMAFPLAIFEQISFASDHIVEDLEMGIQIIQAGWRTAFDPQAQVVSYFPDSEAAKDTQRTRWEHGHLDIALRLLPSVLLKSLLGLNLRNFIQGLDAMIPPTVMFTLFVFAATLASSLLLLWGMTLPFFLTAPALVGLVLGLGFSWLVRGREVLPPRDLVGILSFLAQKSKIYRSFFGNRQKEWVRTER